MKKLVSVLLAAAVALSSALMMTGCEEQEYPVSIANYTIEKEPENVVVLDPITADIMAYMDFERKFAGRSKAVTQPELKAAPVVGTEENPDIDQIVKMKTDLVFCNDKINEDAQKKLESKGIQVIKLQKPETTAEVKTNYETIGKALAGTKKGSAAGKEAYNKLVQDLDKQKREIEDMNKTGALYTVCYLYIDDQKLNNLSSGSFGNILMGYTNCVNIFSVGTSSTSVSPSNDTAKVVASANPDFIIYDKKETLEQLKSSKTLSKLNALKTERTLEIPLEDMSLPGITAGKTLKKMIDFIYPGHGATPDEAVKATSPKNEKTTKPQETTAPKGEDVSAQYNISLTDLTLAVNNEGESVSAVQQRLVDLGYLTQSEEDSNVTGYYGEATVNAVKAFQKKNGIKETGDADAATLKALFLSTAKKAN
ncbi:MAG: peptidoglycan-binding protein [Ruminococcus sp.]|nr:peptidoglycan-binding protein [Ruminococcus sp.]